MCVNEYESSMRPVYFYLGWLFFTVGSVGVVVPVLPTTPFMLLALWAFSKSSQRFHDWLYHHRFFGPPLQKWHQYRVIPLSAKCVAIPVMLASLVYLLLFSDTHLLVKLLAVALMGYGAYFILSKPSRPPVQG